MRLAVLAAGPTALCTTPAAAVTGTTVTGTTFAYTAQIVVGDHDRGCSGVLVEHEWLLTAASCLADNPAASPSVSAGKRRLKTPATIGRSDLSGSDGAVREVVQLVPRSDRDGVLARLNRPVTNVAPGTTTSGEPFLVIGAPGEAIGSVPKAGIAFYVRDSTSNGITTANVGITQDSTGVPGAVEANDGFAGSIAADAHHIAIGAPGEAIGTDVDAGNVAVFSHKSNSEGRPTPLLGLDQDLDTVSGGSEAGDQFGKSLAMVPYRPSGAAAATDSILAVGSPGEDLDIDGVDKADAGNVLTFRVTAAGTFTQMTNYDPGTGSDDVTGTSEAGDRFGQSLTAVNTAPRAVSTAATMKLAVGIPGEAVGTAAKAGATNAAITTYQPGQGGLPAAGARFGCAAR
ncbi:trypsin-like serine protease [Streptomyces mirabilis]|uniref:trypsin-like serine protease n=1 Tax=Streptomyces mirabilis TaxID=68239 RepID=UPI0033B74D0A